MAGPNSPQAADDFEAAIVRRVATHTPSKGPRPRRPKHCIFLWTTPGGERVPAALTLSFVRTTRKEMQYGTVERRLHEVKSTHPVY